MASALKAITSLVAYESRMESAPNCWIAATVGVGSVKAFFKISRAFALTLEKCIDQLTVGIPDGKSFGPRRRGSAHTDRIPQPRRPCGRDEENFLNRSLLCGDKRSNVRLDDSIFPGMFKKVKAYKAGYITSSLKVGRTGAQLENQGFFRDFEIGNPIKKL